MRFLQVESFDQWRSHARQLLTAGVPPTEISWSDQPEQPSLFQDAADSQDGSSEEAPKASTKTTFSVSQRYVEVARTVACHRSDNRWHCCTESYGDSKMGSPI